jgi:hypothetical protein
VTYGNRAHPSLAPLRAIPIETWSATDYAKCLDLGGWVDDEHMNYEFPTCEGYCAMLDYLCTWEQTQKELRKMANTE